MQFKDPYQHWLEQTKPGKETMQELLRWHAAERTVLNSLDHTHNFDHWLKCNKLTDSNCSLEIEYPSYAYKPNPVGAIAEYGRSLLMTRGWKDLPIQIPEGERKVWPFLRTTFNELRSFQLKAANEFLAVAGKHAQQNRPQRIGELVLRQMNERIMKMQETADRPLTFYQPEPWNPNSDNDWEALYDEDYKLEYRKFDLPFSLREELECFAYGLEHLRMMCFNDAPELGLPNKVLFDGLMLVNLNQLHTTLRVIDPQLKEILKHLERIKYHDDPQINDFLDEKVSHEDRLLDNAEAPDGFWWRHWHKEAAERRQGKPGERP